MFHYRFKDVYLEIEDLEALKSRRVGEVGIPVEIIQKVQLIKNYANKNRLGSSKDNEVVNRFLKYLTINFR